MKQGLNEALHARRDSLAISLLLALALLVASSSLGGGLLPYADNPAHLAEIRDLARVDATGWSDLAYCGFPLDTLQSPLTFGGLAWLTRMGLPLEPMYQLLTLFALVAPAIAFWLISRRSLGTAAGLLLSSTLLFYRPTLASLHGMYSFAIGSAAWLLVLGLLSEDRRSLTHFVKLAACTAFIGLTHMYVTIALVYLGAVHALWSVRDARGRARLFWDVPALALGALSASSYWLINFLAKTKAVGQPDQIFRFLSRLVSIGTPAPPPPGLSGVPRLLFDPVLFLDAGLQMLLLVVCLAGVRLAFRGEARLPKYGFVLAGVWVSFFALQRWVPIMLLGPQNERFVFFVKYAMVAGAIPFVAQFSARFSARQVWIAAGAALAFSAAVFQYLVHTQVVGAEEVAQTERMWQRLAAAKRPNWGRVLLQSSFGVELGTRLDYSHLLSQTAQRAGVEQVGGFYGSTPYDRAAFWLSWKPADADILDRTLEVMDRANATHVLLADPQLAARVAADPRFAPVFTDGRYALVERRGAEGRWAEVAAGESAPRVSRLGPGRIDIDTAAAPSSFTLNESFHRFWRAEPDGVAELSPNELGMMQVQLKVPTRHLKLRYSPPALPTGLSFLGISIILMLFVVDLVLKRSGRAVVSRIA